MGENMLVTDGAGSNTVFHYFDVSRERLDANVET